MSAAAPELPSYGGFLAVSFLSLGLVCVLAYVVLRWLGRLGVGRGSGPMRVVSTCSLAPRKTLHIVEVTGRYFLIGAGDGATSLIAELDAAAIAEWCDERDRARSPFGESLARVMARARGAGSKP